MCLKGYDFFSLLLKKLKRLTIIQTYMVLARHCNLIFLKHVFHQLFYITKTNLSDMF